MIRMSFDDVSVVFSSRGVRALDAVDLTIEPGEHVALLGPSGAGKTTLLRAVLGAVAPTSGRVRIDGHDPAGSRRDRLAVRTRTGLVRQGSDLVLALSGRTNAISGTSHQWSAVDWWRVTRGRVPAQLSKRLTDLAIAHDVADCLDAPASELSGGQRQRVALLRALLPNPGLLLADEPTAGLDLDAARRAVEAIRSAHDATVVLSTHDIAIARSFPRVVGLRHGRVVHDGPGVDIETIYGATR